MKEAVKKTGVDCDTVTMAGDVPWRDDHQARWAIAVPFDRYGFSRQEGFAGTAWQPDCEGAGSQQDTAVVVVRTI